RGINVEDEFVLDVITERLLGSAQISSCPHVFDRRSLLEPLSRFSQSFARASQRARASGEWDCSAMVRQAAYRRRYSSECIASPRLTPSTEMSLIALAAAPDQPVDTVANCENWKPGA